MQNSNEKNTIANGETPDPEVSARPHRRTFTAEYKMRILAEVNAVKERGEVGAILRREGIYSSHLAEWRGALRRGSVEVLSKKRGPKSMKNPLADENERLRRELAAVTKRLSQAELIISVQKKVASLLGIPLKTIDDDGSDS